MSKTTPKKRTWMDRLRTAFKAQDEAAMEEALEEAKKTGDEDCHDDEDDEKKSKTGDAAIAALTKAVSKLTADMATLSKLVKDAAECEETEEERKKREAKEAEGKTGDTVLDPESSGLNSEAKGTVLSGDTLKAVISKAEILAPGITVPTGDSAQSSVVEALQRKALVTCLQGSEPGRQAVATFSQGRDLSTLTGDSLAAVFHGAAELVRVRNNDAAKPRTATKDFGKATTVQALNEANRAFWTTKR